MQENIPLIKLYKAAELGLKFHFKVLYEKRNKKDTSTVNLLEGTILSSVAEMVVCEYLGKEFDLRNERKHPDILPNIQVKHTIHSNGHLALTKRFDIHAPKDWIYVLVTGNEIDNLKIVGWNTLENLLQYATEPNWTPKTHSGAHSIVIVAQDHLRDPAYLKTNT